MTEMNLIITIGEDGAVSEKYIPLGEAEIAQRAIDAAIFAEAEAARLAEEEAKAIAKQAALEEVASLGLSQESLIALGLVQPTRQEETPTE